MDKSTQNLPISQANRLPAGIIPGDYATELFGIRETRKVFAVSNGNTIPFSNINPVLKAKIFQLMLSDDKAMEDLASITHDEALEEFAFCLYGAADNQPDFTDSGEVGKPENFICGTNCRCMAWNSKRITINGNALTPRQVEITKLLAGDTPDKKIAADLNISCSTLDGHKRLMYKKAGVQSRAGYVNRAINEHIVQ
ncbi:helix-turn-helix transcriptional regulator [Flavobacterium beibuense]|uniref:helix-turn-helix transcriptional regulator n=1 Tax=Flavobacterium beibuense TaxID=657326 RepID=UPI003A923DC3